MEFKEFVANKEMEDFFKTRTTKHIGLVGKYINKIAVNFPKFKEIVELAPLHDLSKWEEPEYTPYLHITWKHRCRNFGLEEYTPPKEIEDMMHEATQHHVLNNRHHPEYWCEDKESVINRGDRDKPLTNKIIDGTAMPLLHIAEMVADWCAVSEEVKTNPKDWADNNVNVRWTFTDEQKDTIYKLIDGIWE